MNEENILTATAETIRRLDALLEHMEHDRHTATDTLAALRASINKTLYAGMINVPVAAQPFKIPIDFVVPFATLAFAAPVVVGIMETAAARARRTRMTLTVASLVAGVALGAALLPKAAAWH